MKAALSLGVAVCLIFAAVPPVQSQSNMLLQGTQLRLVLLNGLSTSVARDGDQFSAVLAEPLYIGGQLMLPGGTRFNGQVTSVSKSRRFSMFRGQAGMNVIFRTVEVDRREIPVRMSIVTIQDASTHANGRKRKDLKLDEGQVVVAKPDIKGDITDVGLGTGGGTVIGVLFSHVVRGFALGLVGGTAYIVAKKGKEVELPAQTVLVMRLDNNVALPMTAASVLPYSSSQR